MECDSFGIYLHKVNETAAGAAVRIVYFASRTHRTRIRIFKGVVPR